VVFSFPCSLIHTLHKRVDVLRSVVPLSAQRCSNVHAERCMQAIVICHSWSRMLGALHGISVVHTKFFTPCGCCTAEVQAHQVCFAMNLCAAAAAAVQCRLHLQACLDFRHGSGLCMVCHISGQAGSSPRYSVIFCCVKPPLHQPTQKFNGLRPKNTAAALASTCCIAGRGLLHSALSLCLKAEVSRTVHVSLHV
jgi:hypothetical protein